MKTTKIISYYCDVQAEGNQKEETLHSNERNFLLFSTSRRRTLIVRKVRTRQIGLFQN